MTRSVVMIWLCTAIAGGVLVGWSFERAHAARSVADREAASFHRARQQVERLASMSQPIMPDAGEDQATLAARVASVLAKAGLPRQSLEALSPETRQAISKEDGVGVARHRATLTLTPITLPELGRFLAAWQRDEPAWTITGLDLSPQRQPTDTVGGDLPLRVLVTLETMTVREGPL